LKALRANNAALVPGAMRVLRNLHEPPVVDGFDSRNEFQPGTGHAATDFAGVVPALLSGSGL